MASEKRSEATLTAAWTTLGVHLPSVRDATARSATLPATTTAPEHLPHLVGPPRVEHASLIRLEELLGEGGMGVVYRATQTDLERSVAVKTLRAGVAVTGHELQLLRE